MGRASSFRSGRDGSEQPPEQEADERIGQPTMILAKRTAPLKDRTLAQESSGKLETVIRRGQDSNLQSSGHGPDESTNSSTPLLPLLFLELFPPSKKTDARANAQRLRAPYSKNVLAIGAVSAIESELDFEWTPAEACGESPKSSEAPANPEPQPLEGTSAPQQQTIERHAPLPQRGEPVTPWDLLSYL
ncbi:hypothetical protein NE237_014746 [Protea cynaroides]|uniref:Uncharacterized protein n=1 Tax=Protea cynaroides TaxID=273540 RepID=A0A9Q0GKC9_9MAGN|nr:hypothetical protein NE237_014205 [Protea cynaroides]KAJ4968045.1 hypothetical protein NE237_014746 [Protea cynaroides]